MDHSHNPIEALKQTCSDVCHERHACTEGYKAIMAAKDSSEIAAVWRNYMEELVSDKYANAICEELPHHYAELKDGFNRAGVYFNECPSDNVASWVLVGNSDEPVHVYGSAKVYVLGKAHVIAHGRATVSCDQPNGTVELCDHSTGRVNAGYAIARDHSTLYTTADCECYNASEVFVTSAKLVDHGHLVIRAYGTAEVESFTSRYIELNGDSKLKIV